MSKPKLLDQVRAIARLKHLSYKTERGLRLLHQAAHFTLIGTLVLTSRRMTRPQEVAG